MLFLQAPLSTQRSPASFFCAVPPLASLFQPLKVYMAFREVFPHLSAIFWERAWERGVNYVTSFTKLDWSVIFSSRSKYGTCENEYSQASDKANI